MCGRSCLSSCGPRHVSQIHHTNWWSQVYQTNWWGQIYHTNWWGQTYHTNWWGQTYHTNWWVLESAPMDPGSDSAAAQRQSRPKSNPRRLTSERIEFSIISGDLGTLGLQGLLGPLKIRPTGNQPKEKNSKA